MSKSPRSALLYPNPSGDDTTPLAPTVPSPVPQQFQKQHSHTSRTPRNLPPLLHTLDLALTMRIRFAFHIIVIERSASIAYEE